MKHENFLDKLWTTAGEALKDEVARFTVSAMAGRADRKKSQAQLVEWLDQRWKPLLQQTDASASSRARFRLVMALVLHKYGWVDKKLFAEALASVDDLDLPSMKESVEHSLPELKKLLRSPPPVLKRSPPREPSFTQYRQGDLLSIESDGRFYGAYLVDLFRDKGGSAPILEFYDRSFHQPPRPSDFKNVAAKTRKLGSRSEIARYIVHGLSRDPDPAGQVVRLASDFPHPPREDGLTPMNGWILESFFKLNRIIKELFV